MIHGALASEVTGVKSLTAAIQEDTKQRDEAKQRSDAAQLQSDLVRKMFAAIAAERQEAINDALET